MKKEMIRFRQKKLWVWLLFNVFRLIPTLIFSPFYLLVYWLLHFFDKTKAVYEERKREWNYACESLVRLNVFFLSKYSYKWDTFGGFFDHDSSIYEWLIGFGDCDDMALYSKKALRKMGYEAYRIGVIGFSKKKPKSRFKTKISLHFDTLIVSRDNCGKIIEAKLFNYGSNIIGSSVEAVIDRYFDIGYTAFPKDSTYCCICLR